MVARKKQTNSLKALRIGIDCRLWNESGVGRYTRNLISELAQLDSSNFYYLFLPKKNMSLKIPKNFIKVEADFGWYGVTEQLQMPRLLGRYDLDVVHFPHFNVPILYRGKFVVTIHDLIHQHFAMKRATTLNPVTYRVKHFSYQRVFRHAIFSSQKIMTPSQSVKKQLIDEWRVIKEKIIVTPEGVEQNLLDILKKSKPSDFQKLVGKFKISKPYLFYLGNAHPHKNVEGLLKTFTEIKKQFPQLQLVLSGPDHYFWQRVKEESKAEGVVFTGYIEDSELVALYQNAEMFVMPSFEEGFGIPLLEAMACGCPVVSSNQGSLKEVGGEACLYFNPKDPQEMIKQILKLLKDKKLRQQLVTKGKKHYQQFSWQKMAEQTLIAYQQSVKSSQ